MLVFDISYSVIFPYKSQYKFLSSLLSVLQCLSFRYWDPTVTVMTRQQGKILSAASDRWTLMIRRFPSSHRNIVPYTSIVRARHWKLPGSALCMTLWMKSKCHVSIHLLNFFYLQRTKYIKMLLKFPSNINKWTLHLQPRMKPWI